MGICKISAYFQFLVIFLSIVFGLTLVLVLALNFVFVIISIEYWNGKFYRSEFCDWVEIITECFEG